MNGFTILRNAYEKNQIKVEFEIPVDDKKVPVLLTVGDRLAIAEEQEIIEESYYNKYASEHGFDKHPIREDDFQKELDRFKDDLKTQEALILQKPSNRAVQLAQKHARIRVIQKVIPKFLKNPDGTPFVKTEEDIDKLENIIKDDNDLFLLLAGKYTELFVKAKAVETEVKNESKPAK